MKNDDRKLVGHRSEIYDENIGPQVEKKQEKIFRKVDHKRK